MLARDSIMRLSKQPLIYFVLVGAFVFVADAWLRRKADVIAIDATVRGESEAEFRAMAGREPTPPELAQAVSEWTTKELLFREAMQLGLQENDATVRNHLALKLKNLVRQRTIVTPPTDEELRAELSAHPERYTKSDTYTVTVVFVSRGDSPEAHAQRTQELVAKLTAGLEPSGAGDHFPRGPVFEDLLAIQLEQVLKVDLRQVLRPENRHRWQQLPNARGSYLIRLDAIHSGAPQFDAVRDAIAGQLEMQKRDAALDEFIAQLRTKYPVENQP